MSDLHLSQFHLQEKLEDFQMSLACIKVRPPRVKAVPGYEKSAWCRSQEWADGIAQFLHRLTVADYRDGDAAVVSCDANQAFLHFPALQHNPLFVFVMAG